VDAGAGLAPATGATAAPTTGQPTIGSGTNPSNPSNPPTAPSSATTTSSLPTFRPGPVSIPPEPAPGSADIWPKTPPADYCAGWQVFLDIQAKAPGPQSVETEGFRRYIPQLAAISPTPDLAASWLRLRDHWLGSDVSDVDTPSTSGKRRCRCAPAPSCPTRPRLDTDPHDG
jgi:hypothetical protein